MIIQYTIHQLPDNTEKTVKVDGHQAQRMMKYLRKEYKQTTGPLTGFYPDLGITVHSIGDV